MMWQRRERRLGTGVAAERIVVIGCSGAGKSTFGRRCAVLGYANLELDSLVHQPDWSSLPDCEMRERIGDFLGSHDRWIIDGNYTRFREQIWGAADTVVWLDLRRPVVMFRIVARSLRRLIAGEDLWNGNRETWRNVLSLDPDRSVIAWAWTRFKTYRESYAALMGDERWSQLRWVRLCSARQVEQLLAQFAESGVLALGAGGSAPRC